MKIFRDYTFTWKQAAIFKVSLLCVGISIGAYWADFFLPHVMGFLVVGIALGLYIAWVFLRN